MRPIERTSSGAIVELTHDELLMIANTLPIIRGQGPPGYGVPDWEFHILVGVDTSEADRLAEQVSALLTEAN